MAELSTSFFRYGFTFYQCEDKKNSVPPWDEADSPWYHPDSACIHAALKRL